MAWFRMPRSFRTYLIVGLLITVAILTFSTSKMIRVDASDPRSTFPFFMSNQNYHSGTSSSGPDNDGSKSMPDHISQSSTIHSSDGNGKLISASSHSEPPFNSKLDYHSYTASLSTSVHDNHELNTKPEISSDIIVVSPLSTNKQSSLHKTTDDANQNSNQTSSKSISQRFIKTFVELPSFDSTAVHPLTINASLYRGPDEYRKNFVRDMMRHAWHGYATYAWGYNEVRPISKLPHTESIFGAEKLGASIVDGIDTLLIMGLDEEYKAARSWIENNLNFDKDIDLSVFETNIRYVGGLLSVYSLTEDRMFLDKAVQCADKLLPAFDTPSGIPYSNINLRAGIARNHDWSYNAAILSEFGSMHLEFIYLSELTGNPKYRDKVLKIRDTIRRAVPRSDGLYNNYINTDTGQWLTRPTHISMGALGDSFYEYLIKSYVQSRKKDTEAYDMYIEAIKAFENKLIFTSTQSKLVYFAELKDLAINHKMDSLACFSGGMLALGAMKSSEPLRSRHLSLADGIANTCHESCIRSKSHLGPESFIFTNRADAVAYSPSDKYYILRPEILETYFYMWRYTHDPKYRAWAWDFVEALERYCKVEGGYSGLRNVYQPVVKDDVQQSFFLAEVLKYLYLIFSDDNTLSLDFWVFNTEAHPLPILSS